MNNFYILISIIWTITGCIGIVETIIYRKSKKRLEANMPTSDFQRFYVYKLHRRLERILLITCRICNVIWFITLFYIWRQTK